MNPPQLFQQMEVCVKLNQISEAKESGAPFKHKKQFLIFKNYLEHGLLTSDILWFGFS